MLGLVGPARTAARLARIGRRLAAAALILFAVVGVSPFSKALIEPLEDRFPPWDASRGPPVGIVVLGGAIDPDLAAERGRNLNEGAERVAVIPELARTYPLARIVYSCGNAGRGAG